ncbi:hypothetical protein E1212_02705 [Jiangella ureilytica]|uniref:PIN like domain-containing protein n=1 Tax=Jiangella ureilytica TaxID=2530374 RepID=A0A4R4RY87_9ACTN|nr:PIN-like domain-containing protein [Jiangella ureilytica]TDC54369.1 hypothetical protein E1212_02705 [Jiangella ureilytica]
MRAHFPEYFESPLEPEGFIKDALIILDANVLLSVYRLGVDAREEALKVLEDPVVMDRLWMPYQVGIEYLRNRRDVIDELPDAYTRVMESLKTVRKAVATAFGEGRRFESSRRAVQDSVGASLDQLSTLLGSLKDGDVAIIDPDDDQVMPRVERLFTDRVGTQPTMDVLKSRATEFLDFRMPNRVPPGYEDSAKDGLRRAGDYFIWCEILDHSTKVQRPFLFVTDERKGDWYEQSKGRRLGPRKELIAEFAQHSPHGYYQVSFDRFLELARAHLSLSIDDATIEEVEEVDEAAAKAADQANTRAVAAKIAQLYNLENATAANVAAINHAYAGFAARNREMVDNLVRQSNLTPRIYEQMAALAKTQNAAIRSAMLGRPSAADVNDSADEP